MTWPKPSRFSEEAMTDRLVEEHKRGEHEQFDIAECPICDYDPVEFWEERGIGVKK